VTWQALSSVIPVFLGVATVAVASGADGLHVGVAFLVELAQDAGEAVERFPNIPAVSRSRAQTGSPSGSRDR